MIIYVYVYAKDLRKYVEGVCSDWIENNGTLNSQRGNKPKTQNSKPILSPLNPTQMSPFLSADLIALDQRGRGEGGVGFLLDVPTMHLDQLQVNWNLESHGKFPMMRKCQFVDIECLDSDPRDVSQIPNRLIRPISTFTTFQMRWFPAISSDPTSRSHGSQSVPATFVFGITFWLELLVKTPTGG